VIQQIALVQGDNALQLGVFAAPRTEGIWDEVRAEIRKSLFADGVAAEEVSGRWGTELRARLRTPEGINDLRFVGVDGPRWMVRAVFQGPVAIDPTQGGALLECLTGLVVRRGDEARPVREPLPLRLPDEMSQAAAGGDPTSGQPAQSNGSGATGSGSPLVPGRVPPPSTPFGTPQPGPNGSAPVHATDVPRRKPSPRPRRDA
jgi:hypothetical protein